MKHNLLNTTSLSTGIHPVERIKLSEISYVEVQDYVHNQNLREFDKMMRDMRAQETEGIN